MLESLFNKVAGLQKPCNFIKKRLPYRCFSVNIVKFLRGFFLKNISERLLLYVFISSPENIYLCKDNNKNTWKRCKICSKLTIKIPERRHWSCPWIFIINFEQISQIFHCLLYWLWTCIFQLSSLVFLKNVNTRATSINTSSNVFIT